jgi:spore germination protein GerM
MVAFNLRNTIYYYNPQTNLENYPPERYISTNLEELINNPAKTLSLAESNS